MPKKKNCTTREDWLLLKKVNKGEVEEKILLTSFSIDLRDKEEAPKENKKCKELEKKLKSLLKTLIMEI